MPVYIKQGLALDLVLVLQRTYSLGDQQLDWQPYFVKNVAVTDLLEMDIDDLLNTNTVSLGLSFDSGFGSGVIFIY